METLEEKAIVLACKIFLVVLVSFLLGIFTGYKICIKEIDISDTDIVYLHNDSTIYIEEDYFAVETPEVALYDALLYYDIKYPDIVYAQAVLETGWFTSRLCLENNNLFGLYDSTNECYYKFDNWYESVLAYKNKVQYKYTDGEDYYLFLKNLPYAEDSTYIDKVKSIQDNLQFKE